MITCSTNTTKTFCCTIIIWNNKQNTEWQFFGEESSHSSHQFSYSIDHKTMWSFGILNSFTKPPCFKETRQPAYKLNYRLNDFTVHNYKYMFTKRNGLSLAPLTNNTKTYCNIIIIWNNKQNTEWQFFGEGSHSFISLIFILYWSKSMWSSGALNSFTKPPCFKNTKQPTHTSLCF